MVLVATEVLRRRGSTEENDAFTGGEGEITVDLTSKELRVHAGDNKAGGYGLARKDCQNLTNSAKNIANWSSNVSNCITEIPQDIKLELNNGTLTLKAGSKVYVPNSPGVFDTITIANDIVRTASGDGTGKMLFYKNGTISVRQKVGVTSGSTPPSSSLGQYLGWYDTTNNVIKLTSDGGSTWDSGWSFPFSVAHDIGGAVFLDQVFNGLGYIGSTVFALPGIKGLIPDDRNADGTLKSIEFTVNNVLTHTGTYNNQPQWIILNSDIINPWDSTYWIGYNSQENILFNKEGSSSATSGKKITACVCAFLSADGNQKITEFTPKTVFRAVDYNDTEYIAHQATPSGRYIDLTLGASGNSYTMPADGYLSLAKLSSASAQNIFLWGRSASRVFSVGDGNQLVATISVSKGENVAVHYSAGGTTSWFKFIYAQGAQ